MIVNNGEQMGFNTRIKIFYIAKYIQLIFDERDIPTFILIQVYSCNGFIHNVMSVRCLVNLVIMRLNMDKHVKQVETRRF